MKTKPYPEGGIMRHIQEFCEQAVESTFPASAVALDALRGTNPELAKQIFEEAVIEPARSLLQMYKEKDAEQLLAEILSMFRQSDMTLLYQKVDTIVASRLLWCIYKAGEDGVEQLFDEPAVKDGQITGGGIDLLRFAASDVNHAVARMAAQRERRAIIGMATAIAGGEAVKTATAKFGQYEREMMVQVIWDWLGPNVNDQVFRRKVTEYIDQHASFDQMTAFRDRLAGVAFAGEEYIREIGWEIFDKEEYLEFIG